MHLHLAEDRGQDRHDNLAELAASNRVLRPAGVADEPNDSRTIREGFATAREEVDTRQDDWCSNGEWMSLRKAYGGMLMRNCSCRTAPRVFLIGAVVAVACVACAREDPGALHEASGLIILPGARNVQRESGFDGAVQYDVSAAYPAAQAVHNLKDSLEKQGFRPALDDPVQLGAGNQALDTWWSYTDQAGLRVDRWDGAWRNDDGIVVHYTLTYRQADEPPDGRSRSTLRVVAIRMRSETLRRLREANERLLRNGK